MEGVGREGAYGSRVHLVELDSSKEGEERATERGAEGERGREYGRKEHVVVSCQLLRTPPMGGSTPSDHSHGRVEGLRGGRTV
jgi:hypothetical protein